MSRATPRCCGCCATCSAGAEIRRPHHRDRHQSRKTATKLGATDIIDPRNGDVVQQVRELTGGGVHHAFEVLGRKETAEQAFGMLAAGGTATIVGMIPYTQKIELHGFDFLRERRIQGSSMGSKR
jgi:S-(hydroxymethyl)glutathione dehydrogenase/alcohol dehydrogenase